MHLSLDLYFLGCGAVLTSFLLVAVVQAPLGGLLDEKLREMSGLARLDTPGERYAVFAVYESALGGV